MASKVSVSEKPDMKVKSLTAPKRKSGGSYEFTFGWSVPSNAKAETNKARLTGFDVWVELDTYNVKTKEWGRLTYKRRWWNADMKDYTFNLNGFKLNPDDERTYTRNDFYPASGWVGIGYIRAKVRCINGKGVGEWSWQTSKIGIPRAPSITSIEQDPNTGVVKVKVSCNKGEDLLENHSTRILCEVYDSDQRKNLAACHRDVTFAASEGSKEVSIGDVFNRMAQSYTSWRTVHIEAWARGLRGPTSRVTRKLFVSWPKQPVINSVTCDLKKTGSESSWFDDTTSKITVRIETGTHPYEEARDKVTNHNPSTGVRLEKLVGVPYKKASDIPATAEWEECSAVDNGVCSALSSTVSELLPERGTHTWVRVKSWNQVEDIFYRYSQPWRVDQLYRPPVTETADEVGIYDVEPGEDGRTAIVRFRWPTSDESDGTEVSWSDYQFAWVSTEEPDTYEVRRTDGTKGFNINGTTVQMRYAELYVGGLTPGTEYWFRARRLKDTEEDPLYGPYCDPVTLTPVAAPESVTLAAPEFVRRGTDLDCSWSFEGDEDAPQTAWELVTGEAEAIDTGEEGVDGEPVYRYVIKDGTNTTTKRAYAVKSLASGEGPTQGYAVRWDRYSDKLVEDGGAMYVAARVSTGGGYVISDAQRVEVADAPVVTALTASTVTAQPLAVHVECDSPATLAVVVTARGASGEGAVGDYVQADGDTVWSTSVTPEWVTTASGDAIVSYACDLGADGSLDLIDGATYTVTVVATDERTGFESEPVAVDVDVDYARKAPQPPESVAVEPYDVTDAESGYRTRGCRVTLPADEALASTDLYDLYRKTPDGCYPCARGVTPGTTVDDRFAPYGSDAGLAYRVAVRTVDGDEDWADYPYELAGRDLRVDFGGRYVELPYNLRQQDGWEKDFEARRHLDGSVDGYWNAGALRRGSLSTDIIRLRDADRAEAVRALARHAGPCFVRTPSGCAYAANVTVGGLDMEYRTQAVAVSLDATEVRDPTEYVAVITSDEEAEGGEG